MAFAKGHKLSPGRPKGPDKVKQIEKRNLIDYLKEQGSQRFLQELETLEGKDYCKAYIGVIEIAFPKLSRQEVTGKDGKDLFPQPILDVSKDNSD